MDPAYYSALSIDDVLRTLQSQKNGLSPAEAQKRLRSQSKHVLRFSRSDWVTAGLRRIFSDSFFIILIIAELAAVVISDKHVMLAVGVALGLNIWADYKSLLFSYQASRAIERSLLQPARVLRGAKHLQLDAQSLVIGDIVQLEQGEILPADVRLINVERLVLDESNLFGRQPHQTKTAAASTNNIALLGSRIVAGKGHGVVIALGKQTVFGSRFRTIDKLASQLDAGPSRAYLSVLHRHVTILSILLVIILSLISLLAHVSWQDYWLFVAALAVAVVPIGLTSSLVVLRAVATAPIAWIIRCSVGDISAKLALVSLGIIGQVAYHVPMAITIVELIAIDLVAMLLPITALGGERPRQISHKVTAKLTSFGLISAILAYTNFLLFFVRTQVSPTYLASTSSIYFHATTISFITLILCRLISLLYIRADAQPKFFTSYLWRNSRLVSALSISLLLLVACIYLTPLQHYFDSQPLSLVDWAMAVVAAALFVVINQLERQVRPHSRRVLLAKHNPETIKKHLQLKTSHR